MIIFVIIGVILVYTNYLVTHFFSPPINHNQRGELAKGFMKTMITPAYSNRKVALHSWNRTGSPAILFIHGWDSSSGFFAPHIRRFLKKDYAVHALDFTSHGSSDHQPLISIYTIADDIQAAVLHITKENTKELICYGHSLGGVALIVGQGNGQISQKLVTKTFTEGIYANGRYVLDRFLNEHRMHRNLSKIIPPLIKHKIKKTIDSINPIQYRIKLRDMNPVYQLPNIVNPVIMFHAIDDHVVSSQELTLFNNLNLTNVETHFLHSGRHFKTSLTDEYWELLNSHLLLQV